jgi:hypothetical protein
LSDLCRSKEILIDQPDYLRMLSNINTGAELDTMAKHRALLALVENIRKLTRN